MGDNGDTRPAVPVTPATPEELAIKKREAFNANPDEFIHISELIIGTRLLSSGQVQCVIGQPRQLLLEISGTRIQYEINKVLMALETKARREDAAKVQPVKGGIMNFVRRK